MADLVASGDRIRKMINVYVISSERKKYRYIGITNNLDRRVRQHAQSKKYYAPFKITYTKEFSDYSDARKEEKFLKSGIGRKFLDKLE